MPEILSLIDDQFCNISLLGGHSDIIFKYDNQCSYSVWLSASPSVGDADPESGPETLEIFTMPDQWTGSI